MKTLLCLVAPIAASSFACSRWQACTTRSFILTSLSSSQDETSESEEPKLILEDIESQMSRLRSKYPTSESEYLAAARARAAARVSSSDRTATDDDWKNIAEEKKQQLGQIDDWENSLKEAGNMDSQILIPIELSGEDGEEPEEPKLLLF